MYEKAKKVFVSDDNSGDLVILDGNSHAVIDRVAGVYAEFDQDRLDGLTVDAGDWWFNLRPSNTEPLLRLNLEAPTQEECDRHVDEVLGDDSGGTGVRVAAIADGRKSDIEVTLVTLAWAPHWQRGTELTPAPVYVAGTETIQVPGQPPRSVTVLVFTAGMKRGMFS